MWPSVPSFRSFGNIACPSGVNCELPYCIFSHDADTLRRANAEAAPIRAPATVEPPTKRLKLEDDNTVSLPTDQASESAASQIFVGSIASSQPHAIKDKKPQPTPELFATDGKADDALPRTATQPVSPPPKKAAVAATPPQVEVEVPLMPRKLPQEPANWARRLAMLKHLHKFMALHNEKLKRAVKPEIQALHLSTNQLNKLAVDEEEKIARESGSVYDNVVKQRLKALKDMPLEDWVKGRKQAIAKAKGESEPPKTLPKKFVTGLSPKEEVIFLSTLTASEEVLIAHGVLTKLPTEAQLKETQAVLDLADGWEVCARCGTRFQTFPDRREEDGALTTGGKCQHHWGKKMFPKREKGQSREVARMTCCNEFLGSPGCCTLDTHVFKSSDVNRMSLVMPFIETPENDKVEPHTAVCFDCEMGYTTHGLDLLRLTAVAWPSYKPLVDVLVRPAGHMLDLNTRFSGVTPKQFLGAKPYDPENPKPKRNDLRIVTPEQARELFLTHISPKTPLIAHSIENDLNVLRLVHPTIVDTVILYPTRGGLPFRHGLKMLAKTHLDLDIQQGGSAGHDSYEDAKTTGELVRYKVAKEWKLKEAERWYITDDGVHPPIPLGPAPTAAPLAPPMVGSHLPENEAKRKRDSD
ncbi:hypothetical protein P280DRAFT_221619 [Massarina eburnea CBS 473.64]|uniref:Exonuclease domain-containing protein n=1 Tax=Massarina eburnea CBS 473.64 TaxID=1395130 RepID=A0A6A6S9Q5_9PLEO|nr:hypothetical protein P280DRAFT_221619 [Massarina eburnea CBS 473.64]